MTSAEEFSAQEITILLVEDDPPTLWRLQDALVRAGFDVAAAATLGEARASLAARVPRVLLTDLQLPDGHGVELIRETRTRVATKLRCPELCKVEMSHVRPVRGRETAPRRPSYRSGAVFYGRILELIWRLRRSGRSVSSSSRASDPSALAPPECACSGVDGPAVP